MISTPFSAVASRLLRAKKYHVLIGYPLRCNTLHGRSIKNEAQAPCACRQRNKTPPASAVLCRAAARPNFTASPLNITQVLDGLALHPRSDPRIQSLPVSFSVGRFCMKQRWLRNHHGNLPGSSPRRPTTRPPKVEPFPVIQPSSCPRLPTGY
jgi:hypothetical protein